MSMSFFAISGLLNAIISSFFGVFVYLKNRGNKINQTFALMCLSIVLWSFPYYLWQIATNEKSALLWSRGLMIGAIFIPVTYLHFILSFLEKDQEKKRFIFLSYIVAFIFLFSNFTSLFVKNVVPELYFSFWPKPGIFYHPFLLMFFCYVTYGCYLLFVAYKKSVGIKRFQIGYLLLPTIIGFGGGATNYFLWYGIPIPPYGNILIILFPFFITLAILKYHLFEIRVILTEILVGLMGIILLILPFLMPTPNLRILTILVLILFCIFGYYLVKTTHEESKRREEAERMAVRERALRLRTERLTGQGSSFC